MKPVRLLTLGLLVNPYAGIGGRLAAKGSDQLVSNSPFTPPTNLAIGGITHSQQRCRQALSVISPEYRRNIHWLIPDGAMGQSALPTDWLQDGEISIDWLPECVKTTPSPSDTRHAALRMQELGCDALVFAGGDGTARDLLDAQIRLPVIGIPAGVKMHSGVFTIRPEDAGKAIETLLTRHDLLLEPRTVRDLPETELTQGIIRPQLYGELWVPASVDRLQQVKCASPADDRLDQLEIAAHLIEHIQHSPDMLFLVGPGTTLAGVAEGLSLPFTRLGIDAYVGGSVPCVTGVDLDETALLGMLTRYPQRQLLLTPTGGQGILLGRGNQQLSPTVLKELTRESLCVVATPGKLAALGSSPLHLDTNDSELNQQWAGYIRVLSGYEQWRWRMLA